MSYNRFPDDRETAGGVYQYVSGTFAAATEVDDVGGAAVATTYSQYNLCACNERSTCDDCSATSVGINSEITLWIHVEGGGSTYETLYITDTTRGSLVI